MLASKDSSTLVKHLQNIAQKGCKKASEKTVARIDDNMMRHNSCSIISIGNNERLRPALIKADATLAGHWKDNAGVKLDKRIPSQPESNYTIAKKSTGKSRPTNALFSKLGIMTQVQDSIKVASRIGSRKSSNAGSIHARKQTAYLMSRVSPQSQASINTEPYFKFAASDKKDDPLSQNIKDRLSNNKAGTSLELSSVNFRRILAGKASMPINQEVEESTSSTSTPAIDRQLLIRSLMADTIRRLASMVKAKMMADCENVKKIESVSRDNGILREQIRAMERRNS